MTLFGAGVVAADGASLDKFYGKLHGTLAAAGTRRCPGRRAGGGRLHRRRRRRRRRWCGVVGGAMEASVHPVRRQRLHQLHVPFDREPVRVRARRWRAPPTTEARRAPQSHTILRSTSRTTRSSARSASRTGTCSTPSTKSARSTPPRAPQGGCAVYVSDAPGRHDVALLRRLTLPNGDAAGAPPGPPDARLSLRGRLRRRIERAQGVECQRVRRRRRRLPRTRAWRGACAATATRCSTPRRRRSRRVSAPPTPRRCAARRGRLRRGATARRASSFSIRRTPRWRSNRAPRVGDLHHRTRGDGRRRALGALRPRRHDEHRRRARRDRTPRPRRRPRRRHRHQPRPRPLRRPLRAGARARRPRARRRGGRGPGGAERSATSPRAAQLTFELGRSTERLRVEWEA